MGINDDSKETIFYQEVIIIHAYSRNRRKVIISFVLIGLVFNTSNIIGNNFNLKKILFTDVAVIKKQ